MAFIRELLIFAEERNTEATILPRELREKDTLLHARYKRKTSKRVVIEGRVTLSGDSILREVEKAAKVVKGKKAEKSKEKAPIILSSLKDEEKDSKNELLQSDSKNRRWIRSYWSLKFGTREKYWDPLHVKIFYTNITITDRYQPKSTTIDHKWPQITTDNQK